MKWLEAFDEVFRILGTVFIFFCKVIVALWILSIIFAFASCPLVLIGKSCRGETDMAWALPFFGGVFAVPALLCIFVGRMFRFVEDQDVKLRRDQAAKMRRMGRRPSK